MFPGLKCHYFQSNILASKGATIQLLGGGGGGCSLLIEQIIFFLLLSAQLNFFSNLLQAKYLFYFKKKILSTKFDPKRALVLMVKEPSKASLHKLKGSFNYAERSEAQNFLRTNKYFFTICPSDNHLNTVSQKFILKIFILKNSSPAILGN